MKNARLIILVLFISMSAHIMGQTSVCDNLDFSRGDFTNWVGYTSVYPKSTPGTNVNIPYYYKTGIVPGRHTIISASTPDPYACNNVLALPPGMPFCARLGNGGKGSWGDGVQWQRDFLSYTLNVTASNSLLTYKYAVVLQDPNKDHTNPPHPPSIRPRFGVSIFNASGTLIDPQCGYYNVVVDSTVSGFRDCPYNDLIKAGGNPSSPSGTVYRAWTAVGVDLRNYIGQSITLQFETWDCGLGGHFGYAYISARCDAFSIQAQACTKDGSVLLMAPEGFSYKWFPSGETTKDVNIHNASPGDSVYVELTTLNGCKTTVGTKVYPTLTAAKFELNPKVICVNNQVTFTDSSSSNYTGNNSSVPITSWSWNFGDGGTSTVQHPVHTYTTHGTFTVSLVITNKNGCTDSIKKTVEVLPLPKADFVSNDICLGAVASFTDISQAAFPQVITDWLWTFKDNNATSTIQNNTHLYTAPGTYAVSLLVKTDRGCMHDTIKTIKIWEPPIADFTAKEVCIGDTTFFTDKSLESDSTNNIINWVWTFGDYSALSSNKNPEHVYLSSGTYHVQLIVSTGKGCVRDTAMDVIVHPKPQANYTANPLCKGTPITFRDLSTPSGTIVKWSWIFDDVVNNQSNLQNPTHTYDSSKVYYPKLAITSQYGCKDSMITPINIIPLPVVDFDNEAQGCAPLCVNFRDLSFSGSDPIQKRIWNFGDGATAVDSLTSHCYPNPGMYTVSLTVETKNSCKQSHTWADMIKVHPTPKADFDPSPYETGETAPLITFTDKSSGANFWRWAFGDSEGAIVKDTFHVYKKAGTYTVWLYVNNEYGCLDSIAKDIIINPEWTFFVPNAFTPHGSSGINDGFIAKGTNIKEYEMWIFDRWGNMIYSCNDLNSPWNGSVDNGIHGEKTAQADVYVWKIRIKNIFDESYNYVGIVTLVR